MIKSFGRDIIIYGLSSSITKFLSLFLVPVYTRIFAPEEFGAMDLIATVIAFVSIVGMLQLESAVSRYYYAEKNEIQRNAMISTAFWTILILSSMMFVFLKLFSTYLTTLIFNSAHYSNTLIVAGLTIPVSNLNSLYTVIIRYKKRPLHYVMFQSLQILLSIGVTILLVFFYESGIVGVFVGQLTGLLLTSVGMTYYLRNHIKPIWQLIQIRKMFRYSLPLVPAVAGTWANSYINRFVMVGYLSIYDIGIYAVALKFASVFNLIGSAFRMAWGPFFWETFEKNENHRKIFRDIQNHVTVLTMGLVILTTLFANEITLFFTTVDYIESARLLGLLAFSMGISSIITQTTGVGPGITGRTEYNTIIYLLSVAANVITLFLLVPILDLIAVPISLLTGNLTLWVISWCNSEKLYRIGFKKLPAFIVTVFALLIIYIDIRIEISLFVKVILTFALFSMFLFKYIRFITSLRKSK